MQGIGSPEAKIGTRTSIQGNRSPAEEIGTKIKQREKDFKSKNNIGVEKKDG